MIAEITNTIPSWSGFRVTSVDVEEDAGEFTIVANFLEFNDPETITIASHPAPSVEVATTHFVKELGKMFHEFRNKTTPEPNWDSLNVVFRYAPEQLRAAMESLGWDYDLGVMVWNPDRRN